VHPVKNTDTATSTTTAMPKHEYPENVFMESLSLSCHWQYGIKSVVLSFTDWNKETVYQEPGMGVAAATSTGGYHQPG